MKNYKEIINLRLNILFLHCGFPLTTGCFNARDLVCNQQKEYKKISGQF